MNSIVRFDEQQQHENEFLLYQYSLGLYHVISLYSTTYKTIVRSSHGMMGDSFLGVEYAGANGSCSVNAPEDLIKLMQDRFVEVIDNKIKITDNHYILCTDVNFLHKLAKEVNYTFQDWFIDNQEILH